MTRSAWDRRIERAEQLAGELPASAAILRFYGQVARVQETVYQQLVSRGSKHPSVSDLIPHLPPLLSVVKRSGPAPLVQIADQLANSCAQWEALLVRQDADPKKAFFARSLLEPYFEYLAGLSVIDFNTAQPTCPFCGEKPQVAVLCPEGDGAKRSFVCSLCSTKWDFRRILCPHCAEESELKLPVYTSQEFPHVRLEACDVCHTYIKSVDLTKDGLAVPTVDELATVSLDLWAEEHSYKKLQPNLLGM